MRCEVTLAAEAHTSLVRDVAAAILRVLNAHANDHRIAYTLSEIARLTGLSMRHLKREIERGELPIIRPGSGHLQMVLAGHLQLWLFHQETAGTPPRMGADPAQKQRMAAVRTSKKKGPIRNADPAPGDHPSPGDHDGFCAP